MSSKVKEEERIERIIRNLLKLPENRRCINCNSMGPQYVCTTFWTFVCTSCSGIHREFTHRVKSVSMAKFNAEEINALQAGGNERARQIYFKEWDVQRHSLPDGSNQVRLREFIKHVYVDRCFTGDRSTGRLAMVKSDVKNDLSDRKSIERPSPRGRVDERGAKYYSEERRSPQHKTDNVRSSPRSRPANFEIVDDRRFRDNGFGSGRRSRPGSISPVPQKIREKSIPPKVRPIADLLGENHTPLRVGDSPEANDSRILTNGQRTSSDATDASGKSLEQKAAVTLSLIDFSDDIEPPDPAAASETKLADLSIDGGNGASVQSSMINQPSAHSDVNSLESLLFEFSSPAASAGSPGIGPALLTDSSHSMTEIVSSEKVPITHQNHSCSSLLDDGGSTTQQSVLEEAKSCGRKELPVDLFVSSISSFPPANAPAWQMCPPHVAGFGMQYRPAAVPTPTVPNPAKSRNPFELNDDTTEDQAMMNPCMLNLPASTAMLHAHPSQLMQLQGPPYSSSVALAQIPYPGMHASLGVIGQLPNNTPLDRPQETSTATATGAVDVFASLNPILTSRSKNPAPSSAAGNPFG